MSSATPKMLITLLFLTATIHTSSSQQTPYLIWQACDYPGFTSDEWVQCMDKLLTYPILASAENLYDLSTRTIGVSIPVCQTMSVNLHRALRKPYLPKPLYTTLNKCLVAYDSVTPSFQTALGYMQKKDYSNASRSLLVIWTKLMVPCVKSIGDNGIQDQFLSKVNQDVKLLSLSAYEAASDLANKKFIIHTHQH